MDFFDHQERARRNTSLLIVYFVVAVLGVVLSVYFAAIGILAFVQSRQLEPQFRLWIPELFVAVTVSTLVIVLTGSLYKIWTIGSGGENVAISLGGKQIPANTRDLSERVLMNVVEEMALASGTPVPPVYLMEEDGINAFAAGTSPQNAVIGITRGAIETLKRDELQGVIAHEFSHILNGDMRLNIRLMGWLHGILLLAMFGYVIVRTVGISGSSSRSSGSDKKGDGGLGIAILLGGMALIAIGYIGVFFAQLIKAAVSRQREFLADSSAVQFTRNPQGIANALKKIGGWKDHAHIRAPLAEESSHMFFGSALTTNLFATHPPLLERVQRIEPQFVGPFSPTSVVARTSNEIIDPHSLSRHLSSFSDSHAAAAAGADRLGLQPRVVVESVGEPRERHIEHVHGLVDQLEQPLADDVRDPLGAVAIIYALLLAPSHLPLRDQQLARLKVSAAPRVMEELNRVMASVDRLAAEQKLPVACLALPSLHQMSPPQVLDFHNNVKTLIRMDSEVTLFEFAVQRFVGKRLLFRLRRESAKPIGNKSLRELQAAFTIVLSTLANFGSPSDPQFAFTVASQTLSEPLANLRLLPIRECGTQLLDEALDSLESASSVAKKNMLACFAACVGADQHTTVQEAELLRVVADALGCPMPPIL